MEPDLYRLLKAAVSIVRGLGEVDRVERERAGVVYYPPENGAWESVQWPEEDVCRRGNVGAAEGAFNVIYGCRRFRFGKGVV